MSISKVNHNSQIKTLPEQQYIDIINYLIKRDFFPVHSNLELNNISTNSIPVPHNKQQDIKSTPQKSKINLINSPKPMNMSINNLIKHFSKMSLSEFLSNYQSEETISFQDILKSDLKKHEEKLWWIKEKITSSLNYKKLCDSKEKGLLNTWKYETNNALMFHPSSIKDGKMIIPKKEIIKRNTRFKEIEDMENERKRKSNSTLSDVINDKNNGFAYVPTTPSINPNEGEFSPFVTWGNVEGTPVEILKNDDKDEEIRRKSAFQIKGVRRKEKIHDYLTKKISRRVLNSRERKINESKRNDKRAMRTPSYVYNNLSNAGKRLMKIRKTKMKNGLDEELRESYGNTPDKVDGSVRTPITNGRWTSPYVKEEY